MSKIIKPSCRIEDLPESERRLLRCLVDGFLDNPLGTPYFKQQLNTTPREIFENIIEELLNKGFVRIQQLDGTDKLYIQIWDFESSKYI